MRILIVEDEPTLGPQLKATLEGNGYAVDLATDGEDGHFLGSTEDYDAAILDLGLPEVDGLTVLDRWRREKRNFPVLVLTARDSWSDKVAGLDAGADDYLAKPFDPRELVARIEAVLRRGTQSSAAPVLQGGVFRFGEWSLDLATRQLERSGQSVTLTSGEFALLNALVSNANRPMKRERLLELTRGDDSESFDRAIDVQIHRLRRLLEDDPAHPRYLQTVWGVGYVFVPDGESSEKSEGTTQ